MGKSADTHIDACIYIYVCLYVCVHACMHESICVLLYVNM